MSPGHLRSLLFTDPLVVLLTIAMGSVSFVVSFFDSTGRRAHRIARLWARMLLRVGRVEVAIEGLEKIDPRSSYVFAANHRSYMDTPVVLASVPSEFRFFAKHGLFLIPFLGTHLKRAGHVPVYRGDARASLKSMSLGAQLVRERGVSLLLFPEGGRTDGSMREFKEGAAYIAIKAGVPAVPVGIVGTRRVLPKGSNYVRGGRVVLRIGDPVATASMKLHDRAQLTALLARRVAELAEETPMGALETPARR